MFGINLSCLSALTAQNSLANDGAFLLNRGLLTDNGNNFLLRVQLYCKDKAHKNMEENIPKPSL